MLLNGNFLIFLQRVFNVLYMEFPIFLHRDFLMFYIWVHLARGCIDFKYTYTAREREARLDRSAPESPWLDRTTVFLQLVYVCTCVRRDTITNALSYMKCRQSMVVQYMSIAVRTIIWSSSSTTSYIYGRILHSWYRTVSRDFSNVYIGISLGFYNTDLKYVIWMKIPTNSMVPRDGYLNAHFASRRGRIQLLFLKYLLGRDTSTTYGWNKIRTFCRAVQCYSVQPAHLAHARNCYEDSGVCGTCATLAARYATL